MDPEQWFEAKMNQSLRDFTTSLIPTDEYISVVTKLSQKVLEALKAKSKAKIDRIIYAGSFGKGTEILTPDVDLVVIVNGELPPYQDILNDWEDILMLNEGLKVDPNSIKRTNISLQFKFIGDGIEVDLLPASNFVPGQHHRGAQLAQDQWNGVMRNMNNGNYREFSSSLSESQIYFMKKQTEFAHQVVRLGKFWYKSLYLGPKPIYGIKSILELVAVAAAMKEEGRHEKSLLRTFAKFLDDVGRITELGLKFVQNGQGKWTLDNNVHHGHPGIIEPSNPFNDLTKNFKNRDNELENLMKFAKISRARIRNSMDARQVGADSMFNLFRPLPTALFPTVFVNFGKPDILSGTDPSFRRYYPDMKLHNEGLMKKPGMQNAIKAIQMFLVTATNAATAALQANNEPIGLEGVRTLVRKMMAEDIRGDCNMDWEPSTNKHEDYDVTLTVPLSTNLQLGALQTSFRFN